MNKNITYHELLTQLDQDRIDPCYFFYGPEDVLIERALAKLKQVAVDPGTEEFNWSSFRGDDEMNWMAFADTLTSLPLLASRRMVVLKYAGKIQSTKGALAILERALKQPVPDLTLVLIEPEADEKKSFYRKIMERCTVVAFPNLKPVELQKYLREFVLSYGKEISEEALARILSDSSPSLRDLLSKIEVLVFYIGEKKKIEASDLEECSVFSREVEIFKLLQAIGNRDAAGTRLTLQQLLRSRADIGGLIHLLYRQTWALYRMKYLAEKKMPASQWSSLLNLKPSFLEKRYRDYLPRYSRRELGLSLELLAQADLQRKTLSVGDEQIFWILAENLLNPTSDQKQEKP
jgi:DNA polymerase-3 subunit delta